MSLLIGADVLPAQNSAVANHLRHCPFKPAASNFSIVGSADSEMDLEILEALFIRDLKPNLNVANPAKPLQLF